MKPEDFERAMAAHMLTFTATMFLDGLGWAQSLYDGEFKGVMCGFQSVSGKQAKKRFGYEGKRYWFYDADGCAEEPMYTAEEFRAELKKRVCQKED